MVQDRQSGATANTWGRETADKIMRQLGAERLSPNSNMCRLADEIVVIKCVGPKKTAVGVMYTMLKRLVAVIGAFARSSTLFDLYRLSPEDYERHMTPTRSKGRSSGRVGIVRKPVFLKKGEYLGTIEIKDTR